MKEKPRAQRFRITTERARGGPVRAAAPCRAPAAGLRNILVAMDLTDCSRCALHQALRFARRFKAKLTLLYVAETKLAGSEFARNKLAPVESELRQIGRRHLASIKREEIPAGLTCESMVRAGRPDQEILEVAHTTHADLIVVATHSRDSQPGHLGSTAAGVIASAPCPVVVVPVEERGVPFFV